MELPNIDVEDTKARKTIKRINVEVDERINFYWEVFEPYEKEEPVVPSLKDDLEDIHDDLFRGIIEYEKGNIGNAVFEWKQRNLILGDIILQVY